MAEQSLLSHSYSGTGITFREVMLTTKGNAEISSARLSSILRVIQPAQLYFPIAHAHHKRRLRVDRRAIHHTTIAHSKA